MRFVVGQLIPTYTQLANYLDIDMIPYGKAIVSVKKNMKKNIKEMLAFFSKIQNFRVILQFNKVKFD